MRNEPSKSAARRPLRSMVIALLVAVAASLAVTPAGPGTSTAPDAAAGSGTSNGSAESAPAPSFPISGFFVQAESSDAANLDKLKAIRAVGGDTVVTFGNQLEPGSLDEAGNITGPGGTAETFAACLIDGDPCAKAVTAGYSIGRVFTYSNGSRLDVLRCGRDRNVLSGGNSYSLMLVPAAGEGCDTTDGTYDLVAVYGGRTDDVDKTVSLIRAATGLGMTVYAGMPAPEKRTDANWLPDTTYYPTLRKFTERFLAFHAAKSNMAGLAGFYHHTEMPLADDPGFSSILELYRMQNAAIGASMPGKGAVVSPYLDSRLSAAGRGTPAQAEAAIRSIAATRSGISLKIAVQDGMGTSKGGAYMADEAGDPVDEFAAAYVGKGSWDSKYIAPTGDYYAAAAEGIRGSGAELWANVEGMAPSGPGLGNTCSPTSKRGQTTKSRLDRQIQQLGTTIRKTISYTWDDYYTCPVDGKTLAQQIRANGADPIISDAKFDATGALTVVGYNLAGATLTVEYRNAANTLESLTAKAHSHDPSFGVENGLEPGIAATAADVGPVTVRPGSIYSVKVTNGAGKSNSSHFAKRF